MYGYQDSEEVGPGASGGKFGLNIGTVTKFEYNPNAGRGGAEGDAIDFTAKIGEREYRRRFFPVSKVFSKKDGRELTDTSSEEYKKELKKALALFNGAISAIVTCFVSEQDFKDAVSAPISNFKDFAQIVQRLVHSTPNWDKIPVDIFLRYQFTPQGDNETTYLEFPENGKHGLCITKSLGAGFKEDRTDTHLKYFNEEGVTHPFKRGTWFVNNNYAKVAKVTSTPTMPVGDTNVSW